MTFARAASIVDVRNFSCAHSPIEDIYFVYFSYEICDCCGPVLAYKQRLIIG
jgi:hypothetical protein